MRELPGSDTELVSPGLAGGFFTIEPLGKPLSNIYLVVVVVVLNGNFCVFASFLSLNEKIQSIHV